MLAKVNVTVKSAAPNGKALLSFVALTGAPTALKILDVNAAAMPGAVAAPKWVQVGPGPNVGLAIGFTPLGTGESFNVKVIVSNSLPAGSPSDPDTLVVSATNVTAGGPFTFSVPSLAVGASVEFPLPAALVLNTGASTSVVTAQLTGLGLSKSATYSPVSDSGQTPVDATFGAFLKMVPPAPLSFGQLQLGVNVITTSLTVMANTGFEVAVNDEGLTAWRLTQFDGVSYQAAQLSEPLRISSPQNPNVTAGTDKTLVSGEVSGQAGDQGQDFPVTLVQVLHYSDPVLPPGETYHLVLTFNSYVTL
jgi:hypothetical protein